MKTVSFTIDHAPVPEGRARAYRMGGFVRLVTPEATRHYKALVAEQATVAMAGAEPLEGPLQAVLRFVVPIPASMSKKAATALSGRFVTKKGDIDNLCKAVLDGMNGLVYHDDAQVARIRAEKVYGDVPRTEVEITELLA